MTHSVEDHQVADHQVATTLGLLVDGRQLAKNDIALRRWVSSEYRRVDTRHSRWVQPIQSTEEVITETLRELCGGRLPSGVPDKLEALFDTLRKRRRAPTQHITVEERWKRVHRMIGRRISTALVPAFERADYRFATSRWAGGENEYLVKIVHSPVAPSVSRVSEKVWSINDKWSGISCSTTFCVRHTWMTDVGPDRVIAKYKDKQCVVLDRRVNDDGLIELMVVRSGRGFDLYTQWIKEDSTIHVAI
jgi:hypothetical protein